VRVAGGGKRQQSANAESIALANEGDLPPNFDPGM